jgi:hypothetical protein
MSNITHPNDKTLITNPNKTPNNQYQKPPLAIRTGIKPVPTANITHQTLGSMI